MWNGCLQSTRDECDYWLQVLGIWWSVRSPLNHGRHNRALMRQQLCSSSSTWALHVWKHSCKSTPVSACTLTFHTEVQSAGYTEVDLHRVLARIQIRISSSTWALHVWKHSCKSTWASHALSLSTRKCKIHDTLRLICIEFLQGCKSATLHQHELFMWGNKVMWKERNHVTTGFCSYVCSRAWRATNL